MHVDRHVSDWLDQPGRAPKAVRRPSSAGAAYPVLVRLAATLWITWLGAAAAPRATAAVTPNDLFTSGAVLQRLQSIPVWGAASEGERVTVTLAKQRAIATARGGRWKVDLAPVPAGGPYTLTISGRNRIVIPRVMVGDVYLCSGQSNMEWPVALSANGEQAVSEARDPLLRLYMTPRGISDKPAATVAGRWQECTPESARGFSAVAYYFGRRLRHTLGVPVGLIESAWSGTPAQSWISRSALLGNRDTAPLITAYDQLRTVYEQTVSVFEAEREVEQALVDPKAGSKSRSNRLTNDHPPPDPSNQTSPSVLYNSMIAPLMPYAIKGVIWYQGESNTGAPSLYRSLFATLIADWRHGWNRADLPFLYVQLAPFLRRTDEYRDSPWAEVRQAQLEVNLTVPNTGMAVITDLGDEHDIHPREKQTVGERLALLARSLIYREAIESSGPLYDKITVEGDKAVITFQHTGGGLAARGGALSDFVIAGEDGVFVRAVAAIRGETVVVRADAVAHPKAVRYGWADYPQGNLWNGAGLPASPFRTDSPAPRPAN